MSPLFPSWSTENKWERFDGIYYEYGSLVLVYTKPDLATTVFNLLQDANFDDKQILALLLPNIQVSISLCYLCIQVFYVAI